MKKILTLVAVALFSITSVFALNLGDIQGTWKDAEWDANWTFAADGAIVLTKASTGEEVFKFTDANVQNFKFSADNGISISFDCAETERSYKFTKAISLSTDLKMHIDPEWTDEDYDVAIKLQK